MSSSTRRLSLPQTPIGLPLHGSLPQHSSPSPRLRSLPHPHNRSLSSIFTASITPHPIQTAYRHSQPEIRFKDPVVSSTHRYQTHSTPPRTPRTCQLPRRYLKRAPQSDLAYRLQRHHNDLNERGNSSNESTPSRDVDPVYLALKQATARYPAPTGGSRRSSSSHLVESQTPSPRNLSQVSLQDSGYSDVMGYKHGETHSQPRMLGSTPQLDERDIAPPSSSRRRAPKLSKQMKSLSLDCDAPPRVVNGHTRSPARGRLLPRTQAIGRGPNGSGSDLSDWERSCSPGGVNVYGGTAPPFAPLHSRRASSSAVSTPRAYVVTHEYIPADGSALLLGDRMQIVENGDPDWLHGFKLDDRTEKLYSFPATCVALMRNGEQPMKIVQNVFVADQKLRLYRDQVVFAQPETMRDGKVTVRTERDAYVPVALQHLSLL